ncbi:MAG: M12 family metallo-peptidase [Candidatus Hermodarchaeia archaeon]
MKSKQFITLLLLIAVSFSLVTPFFVEANQITEEAETLPNVIPNYITNYTIFQTDPCFFLQAAQTNSTISLSFFDSTLELQPIERHLLAEGFSALIVEKNGLIKEAPKQDVNTYQGSIKGDPDSKIAITTTADTITGTLLYKGMMYTIEPVSKYTELKEFSNQYILYPNADLQLETPPLDLKGIPNETEEEGSSTFQTTTISGYLTCRLIAACDSEFYNKLPSTWSVDMITVINGIDSLYADQIDTVISVTHTMAILFGLTETNAHFLLSQFINAMINADKTMFLPRDTAHLFSGKSFDQTDIGGLAYTRALRTERAYGLTRHFFDNGSPYNLWDRQIMVAHEVGHNFDGIHDESDYWQIGFWFYKSIMTGAENWWKGYPTTPLFSDGTGILAGQEGGHNNRARMRSYAAERLVDWSYNTIPGGRHCNFKVIDFPAGGKAYQVNTKGSSQYGYKFFGYTHSQTFIVPHDGKLHFWGWFRQSDTFSVYLAPGKRRLFVYALSLDASQVLGSKQILDYTHGTSWHCIDDSIDGLTPGQEVRFAVGRPDSWSYDWGLIAEWASVTVYSQFSGRTHPVGKHFNFKHISTTYGEGYHIDSAGSSQWDYRFYGLTGENFTVGAGGSIQISGYFRHDDTFYGSFIISNRKSYVYLLDANGYYLEQILLLDWTNSTDWGFTTKTFSNLDAGTYRIGIGRRDAWTHDWKLVVEWAEVIISSS